MADELPEQERLNRQRIVEIARTTHPGRADIADLEAYARGELTLEEVRARVRVEERKHNWLKDLYAWVRKPKPMTGQAYMAIGYFVAFCVFWSAWAYCWVTYGFLFGFGLGWLPAAILAMFAVALWPFFVIALIVFWAPAIALVAGVANSLFR